MAAAPIARMRRLPLVSSLQCALRQNATSPGCGARFFGNQQHTMLPMRVEARLNPAWMNQRVSFCPVGPTNGAGARVSASFRPGPCPIARRSEPFGPMNGTKPLPTPYAGQPRHPSGCVRQSRIVSPPGRTNAFPIRSGTMGMTDRHPSRRGRAQALGCSRRIFVFQARRAAPRWRWFICFQAALIPDRVRVFSDVEISLHRRSARRFMGFALSVVSVEEAAWGDQSSAIGHLPWNKPMSFARRSAPPSVQTL